MLYVFYYLFMYITMFIYITIYCDLLYYLINLGTYLIFIVRVVMTLATLVFQLCVNKQFDISNTHLQT